MQPIFVYGTVMSEGSNHHCMDTGIYVREAVTACADYSLINMIMCPAVTHGKSKIAGELYLASDAVIETLDILESNGNFYERELVEIDDYPDMVWMYMLMDGIVDASVFPTIEPILNISTWSNNA